MSHEMCRAQDFKSLHDLCIVLLTIEIYCFNSTLQYPNPSITLWTNCTLVGRRGLEPPTLAGHAPQACAYTNSATGPCILRVYHFTLVNVLSTTSLHMSLFCTSKKRNFPPRPRVCTKRFFLGTSN